MIGLSHNLIVVFHNNDYLLEHSKKRIKILKKEGHDISIKDDVDF
jgi:hypothetical protein